MTDTCFDTGIIVDTLSGHHGAMAELRRVKRAWISRITWLEVMAEVPAAARDETEKFLANFAIREVTPEIARRAATLKAERPQLSLAAALVFASAQEHGSILVTRNSAEFPPHIPGIRIPYSH
ncbi:PIN domain-containing protein [Novosphingobium flavum]|uniref:PIN domain-containing protein n=1 Tax=Novosphingobium flavum TaxID=1778672 RepID=A0A7X1KMG2_9SPHN|nr:PIN domain-containing protein [Novosphingobium flavum]MBC2666597.1 PIN domain-containing protein [Novosphingobium flavum]